MRQLVSAALLVFVPLVLGCEGPEGPMGPEGPEGPPGEDAPGTRLVYSGQLDGNGEVVEGPLPDELSLADPPALTCYVSDVPQGPYWVASDEDECGLESDAEGDVWIFLNNAPADWYYLFVIVY